MLLVVVDWGCGAASGYPSWGTFIATVYPAHGSVPRKWRMELIGVVGSHRPRNSSPRHCVPTAWRSDFCLQPMRHPEMIFTTSNTPFRRTKKKENGKRAKVIVAPKNAANTQKQTRYRGKRQKDNLPNLNRTGDFSIYYYSYSRTP